MSDLRQLAETQDGVIYIEQFEEWLDTVVAELKEKKDEASIEAGKRSVRIFKDEYEDDPYYEGKKHAYGDVIKMIQGDVV